MKDPGNREAATRGRLFCWHRGAGSGCRMPVPAASAHAKGFTLIEMIMVIVILGVLAVFVAPRMLGTSDFYARGFTMRRWVICVMHKRRPLLSAAPCA
jgi:prepilin-type N-terminal cleavage/methylation domain-containing protein